MTLDPSIEATIRRLLARKLPKRQIAREVGVSRTTIAKIARGDRPDYEARRRQSDLARRRVQSLGTSSFERCGRCGRLVRLPCRACHLEALRLRPHQAAEPCDLELREGDRARYEALAAGKRRWQFGDTNPVLVAVAWETVIQAGDLLYLHFGRARPAADLETADRREFARRFLGVAMAASFGRDARPIRVATTGAFLFDCPSSRWLERGDVMGPAARRRLANQRLTAVEARAAVAEVLRPSRGGQVLVQIGALP